MSTPLRVSANPVGDLLPSLRTVNFAVVVALVVALVVACAVVVAVTAAVVAVVVAVAVAVTAAVVAVVVAVAVAIVGEVAAFSNLIDGGNAVATVNVIHCCCYLLMLLFSRCHCW